MKYMYTKFFSHRPDSGPTSIRVVSATPTSVRLGWDLPEKASCYGRAQIVLILFDRASNSSTVVTLSSKTTYFDIVSLKGGSDYDINLGLQLVNGVSGQTSFQFATRKFFIYTFLRMCSV